jgi:hypothetical protein
MINIEIIPDYNENTKLHFFKKILKKNSNLNQFDN